MFWRLLCISILYFQATALFATEVDSLQNLLNELSDPRRKADVGIQLGYLMLLEDEIDQSMVYANAALDDAKKGRYEQGQGKAWVLIGELNVAYERFDLATECLEKGLKLQAPYGNAEIVRDIYFKLANVAKAKEDNGSAISYLQKGAVEVERMNALKEAADLYWVLGEFLMIDDDSGQAMMNWKTALSLLDVSNDLKAMSEAQGKLGEFYLHKGNVLKAMPYFEKSLEIAKKSKNKEVEASAYRSLARGKIEAGKMSEGKSLLEKSLELEAKANNYDGVSYTYLLLGNVFLSKDSLEKAKEFFEYSKNAGEHAKLLPPIVQAILHLGDVELKGKHYLEALDIYQTAFEKAENGKDEKGIAYSYSRIAHCYLKMKQIDVAHNNFKSSNNIARKLKLKELLANNYIALSNINSNSGNLNMALQQANNGYNIASELGVNKIKMEAAAALHSVYLQKKDYKKALYNFDLFRGLKDSIAALETEKLMSDLEARYALSTNQQQVKLKTAQKDRENLELRKQKNMRNALILGILLLSLSLVYGVRMYRQKQMDNELLERQKKEIHDSISYAGRIQTAVFPPEEDFTNLFPQHFVFFKPKEIVSGDFYWIKELGDKVVIVLADSTSHGVAGAFMSMLGVAYLNELISEHSEIKADVLLGTLREKIRLALWSDAKKRQLEDSIKMAVCIVDRTGLEIQFAGAFTPLVIARARELHRLNGDPMSLGGVYQDKEFTVKTWKILPNDTLYLFSEGLLEQFRSAQLKENMHEQFMDFLKGNAQYGMAEQKSKLTEAVKKWIGIEEQLDDILIIGVRL